MRQRKAVYKRKGPSPTWKCLKAVTECMIKKRKERYVLVQKDNLLAEDSDCAFFKNVKSHKSAERPKVNDVRLLFPGKSNMEVANVLSTYFTEVLNEFNPLSPTQVPVTYNCSLPMLPIHEIAARIKYFKKPKSMVKGKIFPALMTKYADFLASSVPCAGRKSM